LWGGFGGVFCFFNPSQAVDKKKEDVLRRSFRSYLHVQNESKIGGGAKGRSWTEEEGKTKKRGKRRGEVP